MGRPVHNADRRPFLRGNRSCHPPSRPLAAYLGVQNNRAHNLNQPH
jgi:hypothetical protein